MNENMPKYGSYFVTCMFDTCTSIHIEQDAQTCRTTPRVWIVQQFFAWKYSSGHMQHNLITYHKSGNSHAKISLYEKCSWCSILQLCQSAMLFVVNGFHMLVSCLTSTINLFQQQNFPGMQYLNRSSKVLTVDLPLFHCHNRNSCNIEQSLHRKGTNVFDFYCTQFFREKL